MVLILWEKHVQVHEVCRRGISKTHYEIGVVKKSGFFTAGINAGMFLSSYMPAMV